MPPHATLVATHDVTASHIFPWNATQDVTTSNTHTASRHNQTPPHGTTTAFRNKHVEHLRMAWKDMELYGMSWNLVEHSIDGPELRIELL